jgi:hypothetical protein
MENRSWLFVLVLSIAVLAGWLLRSTDSVWSIRASSPRVVGGYGDHFAYDGKGVRPIEGSLELHLNASRLAGTLTVTLQTTDTSGPLHVSSATSLEGKVKLVSQIERSNRIETGIFLYGDTGTGGPELPRTYASLAGWSRFDLFVGEELVYSGLHGEWALIDALRRSDGAIRQSGLIYSPLLRTKTGFSEPGRDEFLLVLHSDEPDVENRPPFAIVLHLVFEQIEIESAPQTDRE